MFLYILSKKYTLHTSSFYSKRKTHRCLNFNQNSFPVSKSTTTKKEHSYIFFNNEIISENDTFLRGSK